MMAVQDADPRPLAGEPLALDLVNTQWMAAGAPADLLATPEGTLAWLTAVGLPVAPGPETRQALLQARQAIRDAVSGYGGAAAADRLNAVLSHGHLRLSLGPDMVPEQALETGEAAWRPAVMAATNLLDLLRQAPGRIRSCEHPDCVLWFYDTTRNGTRRWCSMAVCGNRAKARRHYDRVRRPGTAAPAG